MREIEFRAWLKKEKKMVEVVSINFNDKVIAYNDNEKKELCINCSFEDIELIEFTGLEDKNGVKIFECDIVNSYMEKCVVCWNERHCCFETRKNNSYTQLGLLSTRFLEVIGNIYENPELLGEKNE